MSKVFLCAGLLAGLAGIYFLARAVIALAKKESAASSAKKMVAAVAVFLVCAVAYNSSLSPEEKAEMKARQEARTQAEEEQKVAEQRAAEEKRQIEEQAAKAKAEAERQAAEARKVAEEQKAQADFEKELLTGWNVSTTDSSEDNTNIRKTAALVVKYPNHVHEAEANWINVADAMKKPWEYYGKVVNMSGYVYAIEQFPPGSSTAKFFGGQCYYAMLATDDGVAVSMHIIGDSSGVEENMRLNVKGYIYGHEKLVNKLGGGSRGLAFVGFAE